MARCKKLYTLQVLPAVGASFTAHCPDGYDGTSSVGGITSNISQFDADLMARDLAESSVRCTAYTDCRAWQALTFDPPSITINGGCDPHEPGCECDPLPTCSFEAFVGGGAFQMFAEQNYHPGSEPYCDASTFGASGSVRGIFYWKGLANLSCTVTVLGQACVAGGCSGGASVAVYQNGINIGGADTGCSGGSAGAVNLLAWRGGVPGDLIEVIFTASVVCGPGAAYQSQGSGGSFQFSS